MSAMTTAPALNRMHKPAKLIPLVVAPGFKKNAPKITVWKIPTSNPITALMQVYIEANDISGIDRIVLSSYVTLKDSYLCGFDVSFYYSNRRRFTNTHLNQLF